MAALHEVVGNLHNHTPFSDGCASHEEIAAAARRAGLDFVVVTDHNIWVNGMQGYYGDEHDPRRVLMIIGEEVHDQSLHPQVNHLLVYGVNREVAQYAYDPQLLIDAVNKYGGLAVIAHPHDGGSETFHVDGIPWIDWDVAGFHGLEIWNYMTSFSATLTGRMAAIRSAFNPEETIVGPKPETLAKWDELLAAGNRVVALGNADGHGDTYSMGPISRQLFPFEHMFRAVNTHVLLEKPLSGDAANDEAAILAAIRRGRCYVGYGAPGDPRGFTFTATTQHGTCTLGDEVKTAGGATLQASVPQRADLRIIRAGEVVQENKNATTITHITPDPGPYRVEAYLPIKGTPRGWIFSNPIYLT